MTYLLGIDVGTTRTAAAICRPGSREAEIVNLGDRSSAVPSVLFLGTDGSVLVGDAAERRAVTDPDRVVREFKRRIGDPTPLNVAGRAWPAQELAARLVRWVVDRVAEREGGSATRIAVTHPASWGTHKKDLLGSALAAQGLKVVFLAEPQAAALHYASAERVEPGSTIAVYDLGGGTFDAAVVHKDTSAGFALVGRPEGLERLGGIDFDQAVFDHVRAGMPGVFDALDDADPAVLAAVARVRRDCTEAKEALSADTEVSIPVLLPEARGSVRLHRSEFEQMIHSQVEDTVAALRRAIGSAGFTPEQLSAVLLVGGSSRVPLVSQLVSEELGRPVAVDADPKNAIAKGAALALTPNAGSTGANPAHEPAGDTGKTRPVATAGAQQSPAHPAAPGFGAAGFGAAGIGAAGIGAAGIGAAGIGAAGIGAAAAQSAHVSGAAGAVPSAAQAPGTGAWSDVPTQRSAGTPPARPYQPAPPTHAAPAPEPRGSSPAALITIGGLFAAAIVIAALLLLPDGTPSNTGDQSPITTEPTSTIPPVVAPPQEVTTTPPAPQPTRTARPAPPRTTPPVVPPPATTTTSPPHSTTEPTPEPTDTHTPDPPEPSPPPTDGGDPGDGGSSSAAAPPAPPDATLDAAPGSAAAL
ncbi:Hsp70 family protein [Pseudonocardia sp.]|uniref:Hsp70 family protein n=1 Tax=Pseudonocardia sp. TaxID=60912 RepID=UPI003D11F937